MSNIQKNGGDALSPLRRVIHGLLPRRLCRGLLMLVCVLASPAFAADFSFTGNLPNDNSVLLFEFTIAAPATVTLKTYSYAGGTNSDGQVIPAGGFDPILSVFDSSGLLIDYNDDGSYPDVQYDPVSGNDWDTYLVLNSLPAGTYTVAVSQYSNFAIGPNLSDGFEGSGTSGFVDDDGYTRTSFWAFDILNVDSAELADTLNPGTPGANPIPTMSEWMLILLASLLTLVAGLRMRSKAA